MEKTKKIPISISYGEIKTKASEFLVPNPCNNGRLIGIKSGKEYLYGAISFIGVEISTTDIINKMIVNGVSIIDTNEYAKKLNKYIDEIYKYKISNIVTSGLDEDNNMILIKVDNRKK